MKTIQLEAGKSDNNEILRSAGVKAIHQGWYSVQYRGISLDKSTVCGAKRNKKGEISYNV